MILRKNSSWLSTLFALRGTALKHIWRRMTLTTSVAVVVTVLHVDHHMFHSNLTSTPFSLIGLALGIFLGFRNNTSYDRFWEGRKLWGRLVNVSRSLTRQLLTLLKLPEEQRHGTQRELVYRVIAYVHALRMHLRDQDDLDQLGELLPAEEREALVDELNRPVAIVQRIAERLREHYDADRVHAMHLASLDASLTEMMGIQGGCERIKSTPIPFSYTVLMHRIVAVYCFALPFGLVHTVGVFTPGVVALVSYAFFGLDAVGEQIEDPFGDDPNDLPLSTLCAIIENNLRQRLGEEERPPIPRGELLI
jgi:putative membrane protein